MNKPWNLESFVDALVIELDKTRETLAVKSINKSISYTVKDMALDLQIFPTYDGDRVRFVTAQPGESGASSVSIKLDSITDQVIRATTKKLPSKNDQPIEQIEVDETTKKELRKMGVSSISDLEEIEKKNIDIEKVGSGRINYNELANIIKKSRRNQSPPKVNRVSMSLSDGKPVMVVEGERLAVDNSFLPIAMVDNEVRDVTTCDEKQLVISLGEKQLQGERHHLVIALDPYSVFKMTLDTPDS